MADKALGAATLTVDLGALVANWRLLQTRVGGTDCGAVLKADGYGTGAARAAPALAAAGCRTFFVAQAEEGLNLRALLGPGPEIFVLNGSPRGAEAILVEAGLVPVLNSFEDIVAWAGAAARQRAAVHLDTGMTRLGLSAEEVKRLVAADGLLASIDVCCWLSHLACAEEFDNSMNAEQRAAFAALLQSLPSAPASLANSSGIFLGPDYHFDLVRPGIALYGGNPTPGRTNPMAPVVRLEAPIIQFHHVDSPKTVGYGAAHRIERPSRIATIPVGYADGYVRALGGRGYGFIGDVRVPVIGRVSMDLITLDVSDVAPADVRIGTAVTLLGGGVDIDALAACADTISYELLTSLGPRYRRIYVGDSSGPADDGA
jgi:alanine racemase